VKPLTRRERLALVGKPFIRGEHDFKRGRAAWEQAVFDNAVYFMTLNLRLPVNHPDQRQHWPTFPLARAFADTSEGVCIYAVTETERSTILERKAWDDWAERWERRE
jgi:hypothetical protein